VFVIEDIFYLEGRGLVVTGNLSSEAETSNYQVGSLVRITRPDHSSAECSVVGVGRFTRCFTDLYPVGLLLDGSLEHKEIPRGSLLSVVKA
jgi:hypothetical protein